MGFAVDLFAGAFRFIGRHLLPSGESASEKATEAVYKMDSYAPVIKQPRPLQPAASEAVSHVAPPVPKEPAKVVAAPKPQAAPPAKAEAPAAPLKPAVPAIDSPVDMETYSSAKSILDLQLECDYGLFKEVFPQLMKHDLSVFDFALKHTSEPKVYALNLVMMGKTERQAYYKQAVAGMYNAETGDLSKLALVGEPVPTDIWGGLLPKRGN